MNKIKMFIIKEVDRMHDAKISTILMSVNKSFLPPHLLDESGDGLMELLKGE
jgi:hypothetical protein